MGLSNEELRERARQFQNREDAIRAEKDSAAAAAADVSSGVVVSLLQYGSNSQLAQKLHTHLRILSRLESIDLSVCDVSDAKSLASAVALSSCAFMTEPMYSAWVNPTRDAIEANVMSVFASR